MPGGLAGLSGAAAWAAGLVLLASAVTGCDDQEGAAEPDRPSRSPSTSAQERTEEPGRSPSPSPAQASDAASANPLRSVPDLPATGDPEALAAQLTRVVRVLTDGARAADVRRAAHFEQLAARLLGTGAQQLSTAVLSRLDGATRARTRRHLEAAALLNAMTEPASELPDWRIVDPPPPDQLLEHYRFAARRVGVPWNYLAAIHLVETRMGRLRGVSTAGALGPMQFLPTTWDLYGQGGDINDPRDAILAAARLLRANGAPGDMAEAVWHYNPSDNYVGAVTRYAEQLRLAPATYRSYWHWQVLYKHVRGTYVLEVGYPEVRPRMLG